MLITNVSDLRKKFDAYLYSVINFDETITITTNNGNVVLISKSQYNAMLETIYLVSQKGLLEKIKEGEKEDISSMST